MLHRRYLFPLFFGLVLAFLGLAAHFSPAQAAPAAPVDIPLTQPDGTTFTARQWGDEWLHGFETADGYTILQVEDGAWVYAARGDDGQLAPVLEGGQMLRVGQAAPPNLSLNARPDLPSDSPALEADPGGPVRGQNIGTQRMLMVMVNFTDRTRTYTTTYFQDKGFGASNSIKDFYADASFGLLSLLPAWETQGTSNDGMIEVTLGINHPSDTDQSRTIAAAVYNAIDSSINFALFDSDGDGYVSSTELHLIMIIAGYEESYGGCTTPCIWAHQWTLASPLLLDGKWLGTNSADGDYGGYAMFGEIHYNHAATIGIMAHELGHDLSWPDLYDTDSSSSGVGEWSIMGSGSWNMTTYDGDTPALPDAWLKWYQGWITPTPAVDGLPYILDRANSTAEALLMGTNANGVDWDFTKHSGTGEFFLAENRQLNGYDAGLPGCGILIWHIDETRTYTNSANATDTRPLVYLEQADGLNQMLNPANRGDAGDPFPGSTSKTLFNDSTTPNSRYYSGASSNHGLTINTTTCSSAMTVTYSGDGIGPTPVLWLPAIRDQQGYTGRVTYKGAAAAGQTIEMYLTTNNWSTSTRIETATTDSAGNYAFVLPPIGGSTKVGVQWVNPDGSYTTPQLTAWVCDEVAGLPTDKYTCSFDTQDVVLDRPTPGAAVNLPYTFRWFRRTTTSDQYEVDWWNSSLGYYLWTDPKLPYVSSFTLYSIPSYWPLNYVYKWAVYAFGSNGIGIPYWYRYVYFNDRSSPPFEGAGRTSDLLSSPDGPGYLRIRPIQGDAAPEPRLAGERITPR